MVLSLIFFIITGLRFSEAKALKPLKLRMTNWAQASRIIQVNPIVGIGLGNYEIQVPAFTRAGESQSIFAHNFFLQWIAETGILFSLLLLILLFVMMKKTIKEFFRRENIIFSAIVLAVLLYNLIDIGIYLTGAGIAITIALSQIYWSDKKKFRLPLLLITPLLLFMMVNFFADNAQKKADINLSQNNSLAAERLYKKCLTINPQSYRSLMGLALIANSRREFDNAENYLRRVLVLHPGYGYANHLLSRLMIQKVRYMDALYHAEISKVKNPFNPAYKRWHEHIKTTINRQLPTTRY
jgi:tetratricopeptide (TPR) repeat protein